jgi:hypothetical protein
VCFLRMRSSDVGAGWTLAALAFAHEEERSKPQHRRLVVVQGVRTPGARGDARSSRQAEVLGGAAAARQREERLFARGRFRMARSFREMLIAEREADRHEGSRRRRAPGPVS